MRLFCLDWRSGGSDGDFGLEGGSDDRKMENWR